MRRIILLSILLLAACQKIDSKSQNYIKTSSNVEQVSTQTPASNEQFLILGNGIGKAKLGMTLGELKQISHEDTQFELISPFMVDTSAIAVTHKGIVQYYIVYVAGSTLDPDRQTPSDYDFITHLMTDNQNYQTQEGVKPGMSIKEAEEIYGDAVLAYNTAGESREYITFNEQKIGNIKFRASYSKEISDGLGYSGIYPPYPGSNYTTYKYREGSAIAAIEVSCTSDICR